MWPCASSSPCTNEPSLGPDCARPIASCGPGWPEIWAGWRQPLVIVTPDTVLSWRRVASASTGLGSPAGPPGAALPSTPRSMFSDDHPGESGRGGGSTELRRRSYEWPPISPRDPASDHNAGTSPPRRRAGRRSDCTLGPRHPGRSSGIPGRRFGGSRHGFRPRSRILLVIPQQARRQREGPVPARQPASCRIPPPAKHRERASDHRQRGAPDHRHVPLGRAQPVHR